jgi:hypothetical protein
MVTTTRHQSYHKAYTIIESLVVLAILTVLTMVVIALFIHEKKPAPPRDGTSTARHSSPTDHIQEEPLDTAPNEDETE